MKISITGGTGFIGGCIVNALAARGHTLKALARPTSNLSALKSVRAQIVTGDILNDEAVKNLVTGADVVIHTMHCQDERSSVNPAGYLRANVCASFWLLEAARRAGCKQFIFTSSAAVFGETFEGMALDERHPTFPKNIYGAYKVCVETMCLAYHHQFKMNTVCLRPVYVYGIQPVLENSLWADIVDQVLRGEEVKTSRTGNVVSVETVADAVVLIVGNEAVAGQRYNLSDCYVEWRSIAELASELLGAEGHMHRQAKEPTVPNKKARQLGVEFPGITGMVEYVQELIKQMKASPSARPEIPV
jgi:nucleoside-diphosphate-sugar epimerase